MQIADTIITDIKSGRLKPGDTLPGSRNLAAMLKINRNTVVEAYQVLLNEEWVISKERKGIFVSGHLPVLHEKELKGFLMFRIILSIIMVPWLILMMAIRTVK